MIHLDLFSGIGGFALAVDSVFGKSTHIFCDNEPFAQAVLKKHWPESEIYDDIRNITKPIKTDLLSGGFPCQPFSAAGLRRGTADDRHLWPEMLRVIRLTKPTWVIAENVGGILTWNDGLVFEQVCSDLEAAGYEVQPFVIPAVAVNAPHRRDRVWFVAHAIGSPDRGGAGEDGRQAQEERLQERDEVGQSGQPGTLRDATNPEYSRLDGTQDPQGDKEGTGRNKEGKVKPVEPTRPDSLRTEPEPSWDTDWLTLAAELCSMDDGLPAELDGLKLSKPQHRANQLKAYGNAIVPQVAMEILKAIKESTPPVAERNKP